MFRSVSCSEAESIQHVFIDPDGLLSLRHQRLFPLLSPHASLKFVMFWPNVVSQNSCHFYFSYSFNSLTHFSFSLLFCVVVFFCRLFSHTFFPVSFPWVPSVALHCPPSSVKAFSPSGETHSNHSVLVAHSESSLRTPLAWSGSFESLFLFLRSSSAIKLIGVLEEKKNLFSYFSLAKRCFQNVCHSVHDSPGWQAWWGTAGVLWM